MGHLWYIYSCSFVVGRHGVLYVCVYLYMIGTLMGCSLVWLGEGWTPVSAERTRIHARVLRVLSVYIWCRAGERIEL